MTKAKILRQIRQFCLECMGGKSQEVLNCTTPRCQLYDFRQGSDPYPSTKGFKRKIHAQAIESEQGLRL